MRLAVLAFVLGCSGPTSSVARPAPPSPPVVPEPPPVAALPDPPAPQLRLPTDVAPTGYRATVRVDPAESTFTGSIEIEVRVARPTDIIWLSATALDVDSAVAQRSDETIALAAKLVGTEFLLLRAPRPLEGMWTLALHYRGKTDDLGSSGLFRQPDGNSFYAYTQFEATFARRVFPCFDEPDRKTPWQLTLEVPSAMVALSNTQPVAEVAADAGWKRVTFAPTRPLPSYLIAFAVGPFELVPAGKTRTGAPIRIVTLHGQAREAAIAAEIVPKTLAALEDYFDFPYPFDKLDFVPIPIPVGFGCMENPGLVTCRKEAMLFDPATSSPQDRRSMAFAAAHELAHQWFGDIVTPAWWDDIWLNEGLATWIQHRIVAKLEPRPDDAFEVADGHERSLRLDRLAWARPIRKPIAKADDIAGVFDGISYRKAGAVLTMFERWIGPDAFQRGIRAYLRAHAEGNAKTADFLAAMASVTDRDLSGLAGYLEQTGAPRLTTKLDCTAAPKLVVTQQRYLPPGAAAPTSAASVWKPPVCVAYDRDGARAEACAAVTATTVEIALPAKRCPAWVFPNVAGNGLYRLLMDAPSVVAATKAWAKLSAVERVVLAGEVTAMTHDGALGLDAGLALVPRLLRENNRAAVEAATALADLHTVVPQAQLAAFDRWVQKTFGPDARKLGWLPKPNEPLDHPERRNDLLAIVAESGEPVLTAEAVKLARTWRDIPRHARRQIVATAVRADPATFDLVYADVLGGATREARRDLLGALANTRDPVRLDKALGLLLEPKLDIRETMWLAFAVGREPERTQAERWVREHLAALLERFPKEGTASSPATTLAGVFTNACDAARRDEIATFVTAAFGAMRGADRILAQRVEAMDQCIAWKKLAAPQLASWLAKR